MGTHFAQRVFEDAGWILKETGSAERGRYRIQHFYDDPAGYIQLGRWIAAGALVVIPLRHPEKCARTWVGRNEDLMGHENAMNECVARMCKLSTKFKSWRFMPIDTDARDEHLSRISNLAGAELRTDWKPIGHLERNPREFTAEERTYLRGIRSNPLFRRFYH